MNENAPTPQPLVEIRNRWSGRVLFTSTTAKDKNEAILEAIRDKVSLHDSNLSGCDLRDSDLSGTDLRGCDLRGSDLSRSDLSGSYLSGSDLRGSDLRGSNLRGSNLRGSNLSGSDLSRSDLRGSDLYHLRHFRRDIELILYENPREVSGLLDALENGRVDGSTYSGDCCCLVGTIAKVKRCEIDLLVSGRDSSRPAEQWFMGIKEGDKPATNQISEITVKWVKDWLARQTVMPVN